MEIIGMGPQGSLTFIPTEEVMTGLIKGGIEGKVTETINQFSPECRGGLIIDVDGSTIPAKWSVNCKWCGYEESLPLSETTGFGSEDYALCVNSGGIVVTKPCCKSVSDFPNTCVIGACGCSPTDSKETKVCDCGEGKCFDGTACVAI